MADTKDLAGRKAIVTGSATGLGRSIALQLAERGADVIINCTKSVSDAEQTVADCQAFGAQARLVQADVSTEEGCRALADAASAWGRLDILVNNAGITRHARDHADLDALSRQDFLDIYAVNVAGPFLMMQACKPLLVESHRQTGRAATERVIYRRRNRRGLFGRLCRVQGRFQHDDPVSRPGSGPGDKG